MVMTAHVQIEYATFSTRLSWLKKLLLYPRVSSPVLLFIITEINLSLGRPATQSSDYLWNTNIFLVAGMAVDGSRFNQIEASFLSQVTCSHTIPESDPPWWQVDLGKAYTTSYVTMVNRNTLGEIHRDEQSVLSCDSANLAWNTAFILPQFQSVLRITCCQANAFVVQCTTYSYNQYFR